MTQGYYAGITGIQTHQFGLDVIADNLANTSTTAYKTTLTEFSDIFSRALTSSNSSTPTSDDIGYGVQLQATTFQMRQGEFIPSDRYSDLAIEGNGWFGVTSGDQNYFTRDGHFVFDTYQQIPGDVNSSSARLTTPDGKYVTGTMFTNFAYDAAYDYGDTLSNGTPGAYVLSEPINNAPLSGVNAQGQLEFPTRLAYPAEATTLTQFSGNLGLDNEVRSMNADIIDANGEHNRLILTFTQSATQPALGTAWDMVATVASHDGEIVYDTKSGQALFGGFGELISFTIPPVNNNGTMVAIDLGSNYSGVVSVDNLGISGASQSDGLDEGSLIKYGISSEGVVIADFSNGRQSAIGRVAVYHFQNDQGLNREGGTYYRESADSGKPLFWTDADGNATTGATIRSGSLEASNVRADVGLTDMIIMQRAYQANSKTITTVDEMIQKALQMHR